MIIGFESMLKREINYFLWVSCLQKEREDPHSVWFASSVFLSDTVATVTRDFKTGLLCFGRSGKLRVGEKWESFSQKSKARIWSQNYIHFTISEEGREINSSTVDLRTFKLCHCPISKLLVSSVFPQWFASKPIIRKQSEKDKYCVISFVGGILELMETESRMVAAGDWEVEETRRPWSKGVHKLLGTAQ